MTVLDREQVLSAFKNRKSCRHYDAARKISAEDFQFILELGRLSPSSVGSEPWQFVVVQNPEIRQAIKPFSWGMADALDTASHLVVFLAKKNARFDSPFMLESLKRRGVTESVCSMRQNGACPSPRHSVTAFRKSPRRRAGPWKKPLFGHKAMSSENARIFRRHFLMLI